MKVDSQRSRPLGMTLLSPRMRAMVELLLMGIVACAIVLSLMAMGGCMTATYKDVQGNSFTVQKFAWETKIGKLEASNGKTKIVIENYDSQSQALKLANDAVQLAKAAKAVP